MRRRVLTLGLIATLVCLLPQSSAAIVYWDEDFESPLWTGSNANPWDTGACDPTGVSQFPNGCNPLISTDVAHSGTRVLKGIYRGTDIEGSGAWIDRAHPVGIEVFTRFWYRTHAFTYWAPSETKHFYHSSNATSGLYPIFLTGNPFGSRELAFWGGNVAEACPTGGGPYDACWYYPNAAKIPLADDRWYCLESHVKMNTPGVADGVLELWVDGVQTLNYQNRTFRGTQVLGPNNNSSTAKFDFIRIYVQHGDGLMYYDQFAAGSTRIGCGSAAPAAPTPPATLSVQ